MKASAPYVAGAAPLLLLLASDVTAAHVLVPGVTGFASLVLHPFAGIETILVIIAATLVVGASERPFLLAIVGLAALLGSTLGALLQGVALVWPGFWRLPLVVAAVFGAAAALARAPGTVASAAVAFLAAATLGLGLTPERPGLAGSLEAAGAATAAMAIGLVAIAVPRMLLPCAGVRIAGRIAGAWLFAIAVLGLVISLR